MKTILGLVCALVHYDKNQAQFFSLLACTDGYCDISKDTQYKAEPVLIDVAA